jgi:hypothetical protein
MKSLVVLVLLLLLLGLLPAQADDKGATPPDKPVPKLQLGKETTFVDGPFDKYGYIDYEVAINAEFSKSITPEKNAKARLMLVLGPTPEGAELSPVYFKWLDIPMPPRDGNYFTGLSTFSRDTLRLNVDQLDALVECQNQAMQRIWIPKDCPPLAEWLKVNEKLLALVQEAVKRPEYFNPLVSRRQAGDPSNLFAVLLPTVQKCRELASALAARATLRLGEKKYDDAWQDILACHRLGRLLTQSATLIETLVGFAICNFASNATLAYLEHADLSTEQVVKRWRDLQALPPLKPLVNQIHLGERMMVLDLLQLVHRGGPSGLNLTFDPRRNPTAEERKALDKLDWVSAMQTTNRWFDRLSAAVQIKDRLAREKEFDKFEEELKEVRQTIGSPGEFSLVEFLKLVSTKGADKVIGKNTGDIVAALVLPTIRLMQQSHDRSVQVERNLTVAFALAAYHADNNRYPAKLEELAPAYLTAVPGDLFTGKSLVYKPNEKGYLFYSVGPNGKDDAGRSSSDDPPGDDIVVRLPLPEHKKK